MRQLLPPRRQSINHSLTFEGHKFHITIGFYDDGSPGEVFCDVGKTPQGVQQIMSDACIIISVALQHGVSGEALGKSLPRTDTGKCYTVIGVICNLLTAFGLGDKDENDKDGGDNPR